MHIVQPRREVDDYMWQQVYYENSFVPTADFHTTVENVANPDSETHVELKSKLDETYDVSDSSDANIVKFLERPVEIAASQWSVGAPQDFSFDPWDLFFQNPAVKAKLTNYMLVRGNLRVTFMLNGTPQHAGILLASYNYMGVVRGGTTTFGRMIHQSQKPRVFLNASTSKGGCLCVPFLWPENYINLATRSSMSETPGTVTVMSLSNLTQLNGGTDPVSITIFACLDDVVLTAPTAHAPTAKKGPRITKIPKEKSEYATNGPVSSIASAVADAAGKLSDTPIIGKFALATNIGAKAIGSIAALFGFSKPVDVNNITRVRNTPLDGLAVSDGIESIQKLSLTRKQELTIDPLTSGAASSEDTMSLDLCKRIESYFVTFPWTHLDNPKDYIFSVPVTPNIYHGVGKEVNPTLLHYMSLPFGYWSGSLKYRFKVIASQFTRGRLAIIYEPATLLKTMDGGVPLDPFNTNFAMIVDIAETRDFTVEIPWFQSRPYAITSTSIPDCWDVTASATGGAFSNGILAVRVLNELAQPDGITDVQIAVFISAGDDFELANPTFPMMKNSFLATADSTIEMVDSPEDAPEQPEENVHLIGEKDDAVHMKSLVFFGERVGSLRQLAKRYVFYRGIGTGMNNPGIMSYNMSTFPYFRKLKGGGPDTIGANTGYQYATNPIHFIAAMHAGWRGSIRYKMFWHTDIFATATVRRYIGSSTVYGYVGTTYDTANSEQTTVDMLVNSEYTGSGTAITTRDMKALEFEIPYAQPTRFSTVKLSDPTNVSLFHPMGNAMNIALESNNHNTATGGKGTAAIYVAAGEDFQVFGFTGAPVFYTP